MPQGDLVDVLGCAAAWPRHRHRRKDIYGMLHARFCAELGTPRYDALPAAKYAAALEWLRDRAAEYLPGDADALPGLQESLL